MTTTTTRPHTSTKKSTYKLATVERREKEKERKPNRLYSPSPSISNPQWKRAREMVADIGHRYIFLREQKGARWNIKRSARLIANGKPPTHPHPPPPPAFTTTLRFMEHSVHSIFSIVDRPYLSYLCFF